MTKDINTPIKFNQGNTEHTMTGMVTSHDSGSFTVCGEFNGEGKKIRHGVDVN
jgi:hypothetical protein